MHEATCDECGEKCQANACHFPCGAPPATMLELFSQFDIIDLRS
jgi:hypothetical protein